jgi:hypothetical protein
VHNRQKNIGEQSSNVKQLAKELKKLDLDSLHPQGDVSI